MNKKKIVAFLILFILPLSASVFYFPVNSKSTSIVITEIAAFEKRSNDCEWIEIYNRSQTTVDIKGWKLWEQQSNHNIKTSQNTDSFEIDSNEYAVIADRPKSLLSDNISTCKGNYSIPTSTPVFATDFSYGLKNSGEVIALKRSKSFIDTVEKFKYENFENDTSLERISANKLDYTDDNWNFLPTNTSTPNSTPGRKNYHHSSEGELEEFNPGITLIASSSLSKQVSTTLTASSSQNKKFEWNFTKQDNPKRNKKIHKEGSTIQYKFNKTGDYLINSLSYNSEGAVYATNTNINITNPPTAKITAPTSSVANTNTIFRANSSTSSSDIKIKEYLWGFKENNKNNTSTGSITSYKYSNTGTFPVNLKIQDKNLGTDIASTNIKIFPNYNNKTTGTPNVEIIASSSSNINRKVKFKANSNNDKDLNYSWNISQTKKKGITTTYTFANTSTYNVLLTASGTDYFATETHKIKIADNNTSSSDTTNTSSNKIVINEVFPNPNNGPEWIELYNPEKYKVNLNGWSLYDGVGTITSLDQSIPASGFYTYTLSSAKLNNSGDSVILKNKNNEPIDQVDYGEGSDKNENNSNNISKPEAGNSLARTEDGKDTDNDQTDFAETTKPTKKSSNNISSPETNTEEDNSGSEGFTTFEGEEDDQSDEDNENTTNDSSDTTEFSTEYEKSAILIHEILIDPKNRNEFVEIYNNTDNLIELKGWVIKDGSGNTVNLSGNIASKDYSVSESESSYLNNEGDLVKLISPKGKVIDKIIYGNWKTKEENIAAKPPEGKSLSRVKINENIGNYSKNFKITPTSKGKSNIIHQAKKESSEKKFESFKKIEGPIKLDSPRTATVREKVSFDVALGSKYNKENLVWKLNSNKIGESQKKIKYKFDEKGLYTIIAKIKRNNKEVANAASKIRVKKDKTSAENHIPTSKLSKLVINEILPNPKGSDKKEFIELFNPTTKPISLGKVKIDDSEGGSTPYEIPTGAAIKPKSYILFPKKKTDIALNNTSDAVRILNQQDEVISKISYQNAPEGISFDGKIWSKIQTPGFKNKILRQKNNRKSISRNIDKTGFQKVPLENIRNMEPKDKVITRGITIVAPRKLKERVFYIQGSPGLQIYNHDKKIPDLKPGDKVEVKGELSKAYGHWRLKTENKKSVQKIGHVGTPEPDNVKVEEIDEDYTFRLVQLQGEITEKEDDYFYLDNGSGEIQVEIEENTGISIDSLQKRDLVQVSGIINKSKDKYKILPRKSDDIEKTGTAETNNKKQPEKEIKKENRTEQYLIATAGAIIVILITLLLKEKQK